MSQTYAPGWHELRNNRQAHFLIRHGVSFKGVNHDMNANAFRHFYDYHFTENRKIWDSYVTQLSYEQFTQDADYSHGSVRDQIVHLISADDTWFSGLRGAAIPEPLNPADFPDRESIRARWDNVEHPVALDKVMKAMSK